MQGLAGIAISHESFTHCHEHKHSLWEILYYTKGTGLLKIGGQELIFQPGDIICQPPDILHSEASKDGFYNIFFTVHNFLLPGSIPLRFRDNENLDFYHILMMLYRTYHLRQYNWQQLVESHLDLLYNYLVSWSPLQSRNPFVEKFEGILVSNIGNSNFNLENEMKKIAISKDYFRKLFKKQTGKTPLDYITEKRISQAKRLLDMKYTSDISIKYIAALVGFDDPYYFSNVFKKYTGISPSNWQKLNK